MVEKPMAPTVEECQAMVRAARESGATLKVAENYCYEPALQKMAALLEEGAIGWLIGWRLSTIHCRAMPPAKLKSSAAGGRCAPGGCGGK